jgi:hypothetical protein
MLNINDVMSNPVSMVSLHVGNLVNWFLYGVLTVQLYLYYVAFPHDRALYKAVVYVVYFLESVHSIGIGAGLSITMINPMAKSATITVILMTIIGGLMSMITQCLYAFRIRSITEMLVIPVFIVVLAIVQMGAAVAAVVAHPVYPVYAWIGLTVINDVLIAVVMVRALSGHRSPSYHTEWKTMRLIRIIVETGCATATVDILALLFVTFSATIGDVYTAPLIILSKVYANSIMVLLNNRMTIVGSRNLPAPIKTIEISRVTDSMNSVTVTSSRAQMMP